MQQACAHSGAQSASSGSWLYMLERFDIGLVHIDLQLRVVGMNDHARRCLPVDEKLPFGKLVASFHPKASRAKVQFLIGQAECPVNNAHVGPGAGRDSSVPCEHLRVVGPARFGRRGSSESLRARHGRC